MVPLRTTGQTYQRYVPGESVTLLPACRHRLGIRTCGTLVVAEKTDSPFRVISTAYPLAFATGAHASNRLEAAPLMPACGAAVAVVVARATGGCVVTAGLVGLAVVCGGLGGGGGVAAASPSTDGRSPDNSNPTKTPEPAAAERAAATATITSSRRAALRLGTGPVRWARKAGSASIDSRPTGLSPKSETETIETSWTSLADNEAVPACRARYRKGRIRGPQGQHHRLDRWAPARHGRDWRRRPRRSEPPEHRSKQPPPRRRATARREAEIRASQAVRAKQDRRALAPG